jgi:sulfate permease, SulP family
VIEGVLILRVEASIMYFNAENILEIVNSKLESRKNIRLVILDLSSSPYVDVSGSKMLVDLAKGLEQKNIQLKVAEALSDARIMLRKLGIESIIGHVSRRNSVDNLVKDFQG